MSIQESPKKEDGFRGVEAVVPESLDSALSQLHLDELEETAVPASKAEVRRPEEGHTPFSSMPASHMLPHPQMFGMGFIPYSQMVPVPHHSGFFPSPEPGMGMTGLTTNSSGGPIMFNNSNDASVFAPPTGPTSDAFGVGTLTGETPGPTSNDPLWAPGSSTQAVVVPLTSSAIKETTFTGSPPKVSSASTAGFRRQTFHAISANELVNSMVNKSSTTNAAIDSTNEPSATNILQPEQLEGPAIRAQSISIDEKNNSSIFAARNTTEEQENAKNVANGEIKSSNSYAAAYPYGGPLMQPNPVLSGHHPPGTSPAYGVPSPFHGAYGFATPFQFSGMPSPNSHIQPNSQFPLSQLGEESGGNQVNSSSHGEADENHGLGEPSAASQQASLPQHQHNGTPPPWIYGNHPFGMVPHPHPFGQNHHHMIHPNSGHNNDAHPNHNNRRSNNSGHKGGKSGYYGNGRSKNRNGGHYNQNSSSHARDNPNRQRKMEEAARYADASLDQFIGNIYSLCKDQHGCRFLQKQLDVLESRAADAIFEETKDHTLELMTDSFGNYLIQKLLERVTLEQRITLAKMAAPHFVYIASNPHGTRALQKLVECIQTKQEAQIVINSLKGSVVELSKDLNGNHIVQKCLQKLKPDDVQFIFDAASSHCTEVATHRHGCCVLQRCLDHGNEEQRAELCAKLLTNIDHLTLDPFGNYVVQYIISKETEQRNFKFTFQIVQSLKTKVTELSLHKFGSNVVEKILRTPEVSDILVVQLLSLRGETDVQALLNDGYGNYVLQTMLDVTHQNNQYLHRNLVDIVRPLLVGPIRNTPHGRRIMGILRID